MQLHLTDQSHAVATSTSAPPAAALLKLLFGKHITYALSAVARLGVPDYMSDTPVDVKLLASKVSANPLALYRVMRTLASAGVFEETGKMCFTLTPAGQLLRTSVPGSLRYLAIQLGDQWSTRSLEHFTATIQTGIDGVTQAYGKNLFNFFEDEPEQAETFNRSMTQISKSMAEPVLGAYDFSSFCRLADVGGGHGALLAAVLSRNPHTTGIVFDLPEVVAGALDQPHFLSCGDRVQIEAGSFFEQVPVGCDAYMMKFILHDWSDEHCTTILSQIRKQLPPNGRVLAIEQVISEDAEFSLAKLLDLEMLSMTEGGRERTAAEFADLFSSAGLRLQKVIQTSSPLCIIEAALA